MWERQINLLSTKLVMISLLHLNKLKKVTIFCVILFFNYAHAATPVDIWEKKKNQNEQNEQISEEEEIKIESPILSDDVDKIAIKIEEQKINKFDQTVIGIFDPKIIILI